jgi:DNA-binding NarL/FixJ family response regulator
MEGCTMHEEYSISVTNPTSPIRLLLVDDQTLISHGLRAMLELEADLQVVGIANDGNAAIQQVMALQPDLVLMDVRMPVMDGRAATRAICQQFPSVKVLVLSTFDDDQYITDSIQAGAKGYLLKDMPVDELVQAIRLAYRGYTQMAPGLIEKLMASPSETQIVKSKQTLSDLALLTPREREVLHLICNGSTNREIAEQLYISESTVKTHVTHLFDRLNLRNRAQLAIYANSVCYIQNFLAN